MLIDKVKIMLCFTLFATVGASQTPFECNGGMFRIAENEKGSSFQSIEIDPNSQQITIEHLAQFDNYAINGICYRPQDNFVYGLIQTRPYKLCRIDADYRLEELAELPLPDSLFFVSGDISPDGRFLVMLGFNDKSRYNLVAKIDLVTPGYPTSLEIFQTNGPLGVVHCTDIAFHPTTNVLFGYDHLQKNLVTIDMDQRFIDSQRYPSTDNIEGIVPSIFFNEQGFLYGIGAAWSQFDDRSLFRFDIDNGNVERLQSLNVIPSPEDACSCPYTIELYNEVSFRELSPCTNVQFEFTLVNETGRPREDLVLRDTLPLGFSIQAIRLDWSDSTSFTGIGTNNLAISGIDLPPGRFVVQVDVWLEEEVPAGVYANYAYLYDTQPFYPEGPVFLRSDDPLTISLDDPTRFMVDQLTVRFSQEEFTICPGDSILIQAATDPTLDYQWSNGATSPSLWVKEAGEYSLSVASDCQTAIGSFIVKESDVRVVLGPPIQVEIGDLVQAQASVGGTGEVIRYHWQVNEGEDVAFCPDCPSYQFRPLEAGVLQLKVMDEYGCSAIAGLPIEVRDFSVYVPNAFSPNADGLNDFFYINGATPYLLHSFQIFDRWGNQLFARQEIMTNQAEMGWDGTVNGQVLAAGVYVWQAKVVAKSGETVLLAGDVQLVR